MSEDYEEKVEAVPEPKVEAPKPKAPKKTRRQMYRFIGTGARNVDGKMVRKGDTCLLSKGKVTKDYEKAD